VTILGTSKAPTTVRENEEEEKPIRNEEFPEEYEAEEDEEEEENPFYWKGSVQVDTIVYPAVVGDLLVHEINGVYQTNLRISLPQGLILLNDSLNMQVRLL
jgi:hypothetical protein